jgi:hypothetical protein
MRKYYRTRFIFWSTYYSSLRIKSDKSGNKDINTIKFNNKILTDKTDIANSFNKFFTSFEDPSNINEQDSKRFIAECIADLKNLNNATNKNFDFNPTNNETTTHPLELLAFTPKLSKNVAMLSVHLL